MEYLISLFIICIIPSAIVLYYRRYLIRYVLLAIPFCLVVGSAWDFIALQRGWWAFPNVLGIFFFGIPLEDFLFFIFVPTLGICYLDVVSKGKAFVKK